MDSMRDYLEEVETWIEEVEDPEKDVSDYDFLDRLVNKGAPRKGNNGLANVGAYLAITEEEGEITVDEEFVEALDRKQAESEYGGSNRISNIVYEGTTSKREENTLYDKGVDGHEVLREFVEAFRQNGNLDSSLPHNENVLKDTTQNQNSNKSKGGDNTMTDAELEHAKKTLDGALEQHKDASEDLYDAVETAVSLVNRVDDVENERDAYRDDELDLLRSFQSYLDQDSSALEDAGYDAEQVADRLGDIDLYGGPSDVGLTSSLRDGPK